QFFLRFRTNSVPVVDDEGKLVGILSERDVLAIMLQSQWQRRPISEVMQTHVVSYPDQAPVSEIYDFLCRVTIRGVVIVNEDQRPLGMINRGSLLRFFTGSLGDFGTLLPSDRRLWIANPPGEAADKPLDLPQSRAIVGA
ncbi:MAG: CBS domain-containing protein, partial [Pirellulaceae bacterium]